MIEVSRVGFEVLKRTGWEHGIRVSRPRFCSLDYWALPMWPRNTIIQTVHAVDSDIYKTKLMICVQALTGLY